MVVVLPEPLTPTTRITCGRGKASISSGSATGAQDLLQLLGDDGAHRVLGQAPLEPLGGEPRADLGGGGRAEIGGDQRLLDLVERLRVERRFGEQAREIVAEPVGRLAEAGAHALQPGGLAHAGTPTRMPSSNAIDLCLHNLSVIPAKAGISLP